MVAGIAIAEELASFHLDPAEGVHVPLDVDLSALHPAADIHVSIAVDGDRSCRHSGADILDAGAVAGDDNIGFCCSCASITADGEEVREFHDDLAFVPREFCDLCRSLSCECIRVDAVSLEHEFGDLGGF